MNDETMCKTKFHHVHVRATRDPLTGKLDLSYDPPTVTINHKNSVISYQLSEAPDGVMFWGLEIAPARQRDFLPPSVNARGRMITIVDADRDWKPQTTYNVTLQMFDPVGGIVPSDPQIINRPG